MMPDVPRKRGRPPKLPGKQPSAVTRHVRLNEETVRLVEFVILLRNENLTIDDIISPIIKAHFADEWETLQRLSKFQENPS